MIHGTYVGPIDTLKGETALLRESNTSWLAQFDNFDLHHPITGVWLSHGWHEFPISDFLLQGHADGET